MKCIRRGHAVLFFVLMLVTVAVAADSSAPELVVSPSKVDGEYSLGDPVVWQIHWQGEEPANEATYTVKRGGRTEVDHGTLTLVDGNAELKESLDAPGALLAEVKVKTADEKEHTAHGGALVAAEKIAPSATCPADFDAFWAAKLAESEAVPLNPQLERGDSGNPAVEYWKITFDNVAGKKIHGQLARPIRSSDADDKKLPAMFIPQWAGVYPLEKPWVVGRAREGWLVLNILAHDLPIDESADFYKQQAEGPLKDYWAIGNDDRETSYFLPMYLSCTRAVKYLTERPDWNGQTLVVCGASQGGMQTLMTAALCPRVTAAMAMVPAGCDMFGPEVGRSPGWPKWYELTNGKDAAKVHEASRYYDAVNFAPRIKCPVLVGFGLIDQTCPPEGVMAAVDQINAPKEAVPLPQGDHLEKHNSHREYYKRLNEAWLPALRDGKPAPVDQ